MSVMFKGNGMTLSQYIARQNNRIKLTNTFLDFEDALINLGNIFGNALAPVIKDFYGEIKTIWYSLPWQCRFIIRMKQELPEWMFDVVIRFIPGKWGEWARDLSTVDK